MDYFKIIKKNIEGIFLLLNGMKVQEDTSAIMMHMLVSGAVQLDEVIRNCEDYLRGMNYDYDYEMSLYMQGFRTAIETLERFHKDRPAKERAKTDLEWVSAFLKALEEEVMRDETRFGD